MWEWNSGEGKDAREEEDETRMVSSPEKEERSALVSTTKVLFLLAEPEFEFAEEEGGGWCPWRCVAGPRWRGLGCTTRREKTCKRASWSWMWHKHVPGAFSARHASSAAHRGLQTRL